MLKRRPAPDRCTTDVLTPRTYRGTERLGGDVQLLGVGHTSNATIHLAEQRLGRANFYRYAVAMPGVVGTSKLRRREPPIRRD
jgi:hypothetical protein